MTCTRSPVGKAVDVTIVRKGSEQTKQVTLGRLEESEQRLQLALDPIRDSLDVWGHVGDLEHYAGLLKRITDAAFKEGDNAE